MPEALNLEKLAQDLAVAFTEDRVAEEDALVRSLLETGTATAFERTVDALLARRENRVEIPRDVEPAPIALAAEVHIEEVLPA